MPLITETYYLSLTQDNRGILRLRCSQNDTLRTANLKLYNNGSTFTIPSGISAYVSGVKQNGAVFSKSCTISQDRKSVVLQLSSDITNVDGIIVAEIVLNDGNGDRLGTSNFIIQVEKNPIRAGVIQDTETPIEYVNDFITQIQALTARVNNLITPNGDPSLAEVVDARISSLDGNTYQNLKARIDADIAALNTSKANKADVYTKAQVDTLLDNVEIDVDDEFSDESENPVQNKVINGVISELKADLSQLNSYTTAGFNLFDIGRLERNKRLSIDTGNAVNYEGYSCTDFIPVTHEYDRIRSSLLPDRIVLYNASKEKIEVHSSYYANPITNASYVRFCYADASTDYDALMIAYTSEVLNASVNTWATIFPNVGYVPHLADTNDATFKSTRMTEQEKITGAYAVEPVAKMANHFMMPNGTVSPSTSNDWEVYAYKINNNAEYIIKTFVNTTTATGTTKTFYAIIDKAISGYINYTVDNIIEMSEQMGGSVLGVAYNQRYHERKFRISNPSAKTLIVAHGKLGGAQFPTVVVSVVADKDIKYNLALDDLKDFATVENGVYTFTASFTARIQNSKFDLPKIVKVRAKCTGGQPTIQFRQGNIYLSNVFDIGSYDEYIDQSWRIPAPTEEHVNVQMIITIPSGATLSFKAFTMMESDKSEKYGYGTQLNAHLGFYGMYPENTMIAFNGAYKNGYPACITVPKLTADNRLICFHDDDSITRTLRNADGTAISEDRAISSLTYAQILEYDAGRYFNIIYAGEKVPLLSDFFKFCAMTGTKPILSTHPALPISAWEEIKDLCQKYGILEKLNVKSFTLSILQTAHSVLGDAIDGYTLDTSGVTNYESTIASLVGLGIETKKTVEWDSANVTKEAIEATLNAGCTCAVWNVARMNGARYKELMSFGVTEFTDDYNCNFGLLW